MSSYELSAGEEETQGSLATSLAESVSSRLDERLCLNILGGKQLRETLDVNVCMHAHPTPPLSLPPLLPHPLHYLPDPFEGLAR